MAVNKVIYGGSTLIDLSDTELTADEMLLGTVAYSKSGEKMYGALDPYKKYNTWSEKDFLVPASGWILSDGVYKNTIASDTVSKNEYYVRMTDGESQNVDKIYVFESIESVVVGDGNISIQTYPNCNAPIVDISIKLINLSRRVT